MREILPEEHKRILLEILIEFDRICRLNDIEYSLAFGTLLGAVRHHGFIPWDDDIDVIVTRENYEKLQRIFNNQSNPKYEFVCVEMTKGFSAPLGKIIDNSTLLIQNGHYSDKKEMGIYIDVFPYDKVPEDYKKRQKVFKKAVTRQKVWSFCGNNFGEHNAFVRIIRSAINKTNLATIIARNTNKWASKVSSNSSIFANLIFGQIKKETSVMKNSDIHKLKEYTFEEYRFWGIEAYDYYLTQWYGDYMSIPPINERVSCHDVKVYEK